jgi:hypothetical protein
LKHTCVDRAQGRLSGAVTGRMDAVHPGDAMLASAHHFGAFPGPGMGHSMNVVCRESRWIAMRAEARLVRCVRDSNCRQAAADVPIGGIVRGHFMLFSGLPVVPGADILLCICAGGATNVEALDPGAHCWALGLLADHVACKHRFLFMTILPAGAGGRLAGPTINEVHIMKMSGECQENRPWPGLLQKFQSHAHVNDIVMVLWRLVICCSSRCALALIHILSGEHDHRLTCLTCSQMAFTRTETTQRH